VYREWGLIAGNWKEHGRQLTGRGGRGTAEEEKRKRKTEQAASPKETKPRRDQAQKVRPSPKRQGDTDGETDNRAGKEKQTGEKITETRYHVRTS
jgi:hypothetical protein